MTSSDRPLFSEDSAKRDAAWVAAVLAGDRSAFGRLVEAYQRAAVGTKGPRVTSKLSLPGRFVVMIGPESRHIGVSRRIPDSQERNRLRLLGEKYQPEDRALIMRTEAEGATEDEIRQDIAYLVELYDRVYERGKDRRGIWHTHR